MNYVQDLEDEPIEPTNGLSFMESIGILVGLLSLGLVCFSLGVTTGEKQAREEYVKQLETYKWPKAGELFIDLNEDKEDPCLYIWTSKEWWPLAGKCKKGQVIVEGEAAVEEERKKEIRP